ncbi:porin family protein [Sulfurovum sp.]|uniref:porin family protein n=1 Tax=Sulfurovum sp. TaxID=1969726 RepID=UPI0025D2830C|nr:porin family protein [Sulfurovum sp.]
MKKNILVSLMAIATLSSTVWAGGKRVAPVEAPVEPIPAMQTPSPVYIGLGLLWGDYRGQCGTKVDCPYEDVTYGALLRAGYEFNQYFGIEGRVLGTFWGADSEGGQELRHYGLFAKPMYPLGEDINIYGLLGYGWTKTKTGGNGNLEEVDDSGFSAGLGLEYDLSDKEGDKIEDGDYDREFDGQADQEKGWGLFVDYQRLLVKSSTPDMDVVSAGLTYDF